MKNTITHKGNYEFEMSLTFGEVFVSHPELEMRGLYLVVDDKGKVFVFKHHSVREYEDADHDDWRFCLGKMSPSEMMVERKGKSYKKFKRAVRYATRLARLNVPDEPGSSTRLFEMKGGERK